MIARHLQVVSKQPAFACEIPTAPAFITKFQCFGQFALGLIDTLTTSGFGAIGDLAVGTQTFLGVILDTLLNKY